jgi:acyl transferase domain-containing protein
MFATVGMACRFPGADDPQAIWELLRDGRDEHPSCTDAVPTDRQPTGRSE